MTLGCQKVRKESCQEGAVVEEVVLVTVLPVAKSLNRCYLTIRIIAWQQPRYEPANHTKKGYSMTVALWCLVPAPGLELGTY